MDQTQPPTQDAASDPREARTSTMRSPWSRVVLVLLFVGIAVAVGLELRRQKIAAADRQRLLDRAKQDPLCRLFRDRFPRATPEVRDGKVTWCELVEENGKEVGYTCTVDPAKGAQLRRSVLVFGKQSIHAEGENISAAEFAAMTRQYDEGTSASVPGSRPASKSRILWLHDQLKIGMTTDQVEAILGKPLGPPLVQPDGEQTDYYLNEPERRMGPTESPWAPGGIVVTYKNGRLIKKVYNHQWVKREHRQAYERSKRPGPSSAPDSP